MAGKAVVKKFQVVTTKEIGGNRRHTTPIGVAQMFEDGNIHVVLNALPLTSRNGAELWLRVDERQMHHDDSYPDPQD